MKKYYSAAAGSGKTTLLVRKAIGIGDGRVLITTFTDANEVEIKKKFTEEIGYIPKNVIVQTWFSFLLQLGVMPYLGSMPKTEVNGIHFVEGRSGITATSNGRTVSIGEGNFNKYFFDDQGKVYTDKLAKLVIRCNEKSRGAVFRRLGKTFSHFFIDESQDLNGYDLEILIISNHVIIVGDPRQTTYKTHYDQKYRQYVDGDLTKFIEVECKRTGCETDVETLRISHRCNQPICDFASRLFPSMPTMVAGNSVITGHDGVFLVSLNDRDEYLSRFSPLQLRYKKSTQTNQVYKTMNFGESKGLTADRVLIYATVKFLEWIQNNNYDLPNLTRTKLYVAITRAKYSVGIITDDAHLRRINGIPRFFI